MNTIISTGRCLCGRIRFVARAGPLWVAHCHCTSCRRNTGAPVTTFVGFRKDQIEFTGDRDFYLSSPGVRRGFCGHCGTPLTYEAEHCGDEVHFYVSVMDDPSAFTPEKHVFYGERISWLELHDALPRFNGPGRGDPDSWGQGGSEP